MDVINVGCICQINHIFDEHKIEFPVVFLYVCQVVLDRTDLLTFLSVAVLGRHPSEQSHELAAVTHAQTERILPCVERVQLVTYALVVQTRGRPT